VAFKQTSAYRMGSSKRRHTAGQIDGHCLPCSSLVPPRLSSSKDLLIFAAIDGSVNYVEPDLQKHRFGSIEAVLDLIAVPAAFHDPLAVLEGALLTMRGSSAAVAGMAKQSAKSAPQGQRSNPFSSFRKAVWINTYGFGRSITIPWGSTVALYEPFQLPTSLCAHRSRTFARMLDA
jgi:hypothetical protein